MSISPKRYLKSKTFYCLKLFIIRQTMRKNLTNTRNSNLKHNKLLNSEINSCQNRIKSLNKFKLSLIQDKSSPKLKPDSQRAHFFLIKRQLSFNPSQQI